MSVSTHSLEVATIREHCKPLRLPTVAEGCERLAQEAIRQRHTHLRPGVGEGCVTEHVLEVRACCIRRAAAHCVKVAVSGKVNANRSH